ncbi:HUL4 Probable E3 ubiquitin-protein ligase HUL4 [Candida maltosa Xu316]|uniref:HECT-type E3 ubiquitin transferase n=1 Tax=Candida maltosa (strain Xu316) TaxID=1245528 RepID=M3K5I1_CANMX|nr:hypothetical protein G210_2570 [Candida maltosa Xu316]
MQQINSKQTKSSSSVANNKSNWKIKDFLKISASSASSLSKPPQSGSKKGVVTTPTAIEYLQSTTIPDNSSKSNSTTSSTNSQSQNVSKCFCCGTILTFPNKAKKFRCSICHTTMLLEVSKTISTPDIPLLSYKYVKSLADDCFKNASSEQGDAKSLHEIFEPLSDYLYKAFKHHEILNNSFKLKSGSKRAHHSTSNIYYAGVRDTIILLTKLPTKKPLYSALKGAGEQLKRMRVCNDDSDPLRYSWLFMLLEIPILSRSLVVNDPKLKLMSDAPEIKMLSYDILKRCIGILSCIDSSKVLGFISSWFSKMDESDFLNKINLMNLYITFQLKKYFYLANNPHVKLAETPSDETYADNSEMEYFQSLHLKSHIEANTDLSSPNELALPTGQFSSNPFPIKANGKNKKGKDVKVKVHQYGNDWHIRSALIVLAILCRANKLRQVQVPVSTFYNSLVDYVNIKLDFDSWQSNRKVRTQASKSQQGDIWAVIEYIHGTSVNKSLYDDALFYICQYPFLISLGSKISVLEYEARRQMERKAEEAFINSLDKRILIDVYFRIRVRRDHIVQDSLQHIKSNPDNLKKSLKIQFVNEPGVDAGGLKKEWFLLLAREIFHPQSGMFYNVEDSNLLWFNVVPAENPDMYYLFGAILGLAIYNSTILDLQFPLALYKILLGRTLDQNDYKQLYPVSYKNLTSLKTMQSKELSSLDLTFEVTYSDMFGGNYTKELVDNGSKKPVDTNNVQQYIEKYTDFFMKDGIRRQVDAFKAGFNNVIGGNALSLFSPEEIELLLCGSDDHKIDIAVLKSVTKYIGWKSPEDATTSKIITWFWEYMDDLSNEAKKKLLIFVTGSDRVPATGIQNLPFKISLLNNGYESQRLPIAHTCFNELALYNYTTKETFVEKLNKAINESAGFGIK